MRSSEQSRLHSDDSPFLPHKGVTDRFFPVVFVLLGKVQRNLYRIICKTRSPRILCRIEPPVKIGNILFLSWSIGSYDILHYDFFLRNYRLSISNSISHRQQCKSKITGIIQPRAGRILFPALGCSIFFAYLNSGCRRCAWTSSRSGGARRWKRPWARSGCRSWPCSGRARRFPGGGARRPSDSPQRRWS